LQIGHSPVSSAEYFVESSIFERISRSLLVLDFTLDFFLSAAFVWAKSC
jgi:hypothetical protein